MKNVISKILGVLFITLFLGVTSSYASTCSKCGGILATTAEYVSVSDTQHARQVQCVNSSCSKYAKNQYEKHESHSWTWSSSYHQKKCKVCGKVITHTAQWKYKSSSKEICDVGGCEVTRSHNKSDWVYDADNHWKTCSHSCCKGYTFAKAGHSGATHANGGQCTTCGYVYETHGEASNWSYDSSSHWKVCTNGSCSEIMNKGGHTGATHANGGMCTTCGYVYESHGVNSTWVYDANNHWNRCTNSSCGEILNKGGHTGATHANGGKCTICGYVYESHGEASSWSTDSNTHWKKCINNSCSTIMKNGSHSGGTHANGGACGTCGKIYQTHNSTTCSHCKTTYCSFCTTHTPKVTCPCNNNRSCSDKHCAGITWCSYCGTHTHVGCNTNAICPQPHCSAKVCSVCGNNHQGVCGGGHVYEWIRTSDDEVQTHINKCKIDNCTATNGSHDAVWGVADTSHTSTCQKCSLQYTHNPQWSTSQRNATEVHPCVWSKGCSATHSPSWGNYYKVNGGVDGDSDNGRHTRQCSVCGITEYYHDFTTNKWDWSDTNKHIGACTICGLKVSENHEFSILKRDESSDYRELYSHWKICKKCDETRKEVEEEHTDLGNGKCSCGQLLWKVISVPDNKDITSDTLNANNADDAFREAKKEEKLRIIEVLELDSNGAPKINYIKKIYGEAEFVADSNNVITITKNGEYNFDTGRGGTGTLIIDNISNQILIDKIIDPITSTTGEVKIIIKVNDSEKQFNKKVYITEGNVTLDASIAETNGKSTSETNILEKTVDKNGTYYFSAVDTAGNTKTVKIVIDNIISGQVTVAISNDVFINGFVFTEVLVNPNVEWSLSGNANAIIKANVYKNNDNSGKEVGASGIKIIKVMDMQRKDVLANNGTYPPGEYYIQVAIGGKTVFNKSGTYIVDLVSANVGSSLQGKNRIIVEVQELKDLT